MSRLNSISIKQCIEMPFSMFAKHNMYSIPYIKRNTLFDSNQNE